MKRSTVRILLLGTAFAVLAVGYPAGRILAATNLETALLRPADLPGFHGPQIRTSKKYVHKISLNSVNYCGSSPGSPINSRNWVEGAIQVFVSPTGSFVQTCAVELKTVADARKYLASVKRASKAGVAAHSFQYLSTPRIADGTVGLRGSDASSTYDAVFFLKGKALFNVSYVGFKGRGKLLAAGRIISLAQKVASRYR